MKRMGIRMETRSAGAGFAEMGLLANPFDYDDTDSANAPGVEFAIRAAANRMLAALDASADDPASRPVLVLKSAEVVPQYHITALALVLRELAIGEPVPGILSAYVPLDMLRTGRVRAVLNVIAERVAGVDPLGALGPWIEHTLVQPDDELPEWSALVAAGFDAEQVRAELAVDAVALASRVFGEPVDERSGEEDFESLMRISSSRQQRLETDPEGDSITEAEDATDDPFTDVFTTPLGEVDPSVLPEEGAGASLDELLGDYVIAFTRERLSPVVARGIKAYRAQGMVSMAEELKVTKAPTKSLVALLTLAQGLYRSGAVIYDRLDYWDTVPEDLKRKILGTFMDLRLALKGHAMLVMVVVPGESPEIEEMFAAGAHVSWDYAELASVAQFDSPFDAEIVNGWIASAAVDGAAPEWAGPLLAAVPDGTTLDAACKALSGAIVSAYDAGTQAPDPADVVAALSASTRPDA
jgi:hypothetical protein